jgi:small ligand-binding sensory domain FIST
MNSTQSSHQFASALSTLSDTQAAMREVCAKALADFRGTPDLAFLFFSAQHVNFIEPVAAQVCDAIGTDNLLGCSGESIVGVGQEVEMEAAMSLWLARLSGTSVQPMRLEYERAVNEGAFIGWSDDLPEDWSDQSALLVLGDPFSFPADLLLELINNEHPGVPVMGGMASAGQTPGSNRILLGRHMFEQGAAIVLLHGGVQIKTVVSQGCRPLGQHLVITKAERNIIQELGGMPAYSRLEELFQTLPTREQKMVQQGLHVGRVVNEYQDEFEQGDFLIRNVVGVDPEERTIAISDYVRPGQTVQFHIRDADTADVELRQLLSRVEKSTAAALLFTCNGRGTRLFSEPHHDALAIKNAMGEIPLAGLFAAGELGPIGGKNFMHGFTASIALFQAVNEDADG